MFRDVYVAISAIRDKSGHLQPWILNQANPGETRETWYEKNAAAIRADAQLAAEHQMHASHAERLENLRVLSLRELWMAFPDLYKEWKEEARATAARQA